MLKLLWLAVGLTILCVLLIDAAMVVPRGSGLSESQRAALKIRDEPNPYYLVKNMRFGDVISVLGSPDRISGLDANNFDRVDFLRYGFTLIIRIADGKSITPAAPVVSVYGLQNEYGRVTWRGFISLCRYYPMIRAYCES